MDPDKRIGDAERDAAVESLRDHHVAGRLTPEEFTERMEAALAARTQADLDPLFADLPDTPPPPAAVEQPPRAGRVDRREDTYHRTLEILTAVAWPAAIIFNFAFGWQWWWLILIPMFLLPALVGEDRSHGRNRSRRHEEPERRRRDDDE